MGKFSELYEAFCSFLEGQFKTNLIVINQWEVTYVNHILKSSENGSGVWSDIAELPAIMPGLVGRMCLSDSHLEGIQANYKMLMRDNVGRLHVELRDAVFAKDTNQELLVLKLTARGGLPEGHTHIDGLNAGRNCIVTAFDDISGSEAQQYWGKQ